MIYSHASGQTMCPDEESGRDMGIPELTRVLVAIDPAASVNEDAGSSETGIVGVHFNGFADDLSPEPLIRYALSLPVSTAVIGMPKLQFIDQNIALVKSFKPMTAVTRAAAAARHKSSVSGPGIRTDCS